MKQQILICIIFASGCMTGPDRVPNVREKGIGPTVYSCAAGFSDEVSSKLQAEYEENIKKGDVGVAASRKSAASIMTLLPENQRLEGYREYVKCLQIDIKVPTNTSKLSRPEAMKLAVDMCSGKNIDPAEYDASGTRSLDDLKRTLENDFTAETYDKYLECVSSTLNTLAHTE